ncbi:terminase small subunit [Lactobacillus gallinarum]|uniref:terminase small subunit n=1 Tax=Lactobacillus gallinarum TaxID=52242 RepID=UPI000B3A7E89|nr:terminase small subunit [Lactobacillus gallinarum]
MKRKMTPKQLKFASEYIKTGNATKSAIEAGYSKNTAAEIGKENLKKPYIKAYINEKLSEIESHKIMDAKEALQLLTRIARAEETEIVTVGTPDGLQQAEQPPSIKDRLVAVKELLRRYSISDIDKLQIKKLSAEIRVIETKANVAERLENRDNEQLDEILDKLTDEVLSNGSKSTSNE